MTRFARDYRVFYVEEAQRGDVGERPRMDVERLGNRLTRVVPRLPGGIDEAGVTAMTRALVSDFVEAHDIVAPVLWYYTPMALDISRQLPAQQIVYDCMDELSAFAGSPPCLVQKEQELFRCADLVFTGGTSLYEAKRRRHERVFAFPSSVDVAHFRRARQNLAEPADQAALPHPRIGHYAVLDERLDLELLAAVADLRPAWQFVLLGPVVKIDPGTLPRRANIHYLGPKAYGELPSYLAGWDATFMPFARNRSTEFISPTKTPEYLAAGRQVVSTSVRDVVRTWGDCGMVRIADTPGEVVAALEEALAAPAHPGRLARVDDALALTSWDATCEQMQELLA
jgi:UDP-galactopyranose mutase